MQSTILEKSQQLGESIMANSNTIDRFDMSYGLAGFAMFFHAKHQYSAESSDLENFYNCIDLAMSRSQQLSANGFEFIDLTEYVHFLSIYQNVVGKKFDSSLLLRDAKKILLDYADGSIGLGRLDPYTGGFYQAWHFLLQDSNRKFIQKILNEIHKGNIDLGLADTSLQKLPLGITHGLAFYLIFTIKAYERGIGQDLCIKLIKLIVSKILSAAHDFATHGSFFPDRIATGNTPKQNLCYGDVGILYALNRAIPLIDKPSWSLKVKHMRSVTEALKPLYSTTSGNGILYGNAGLYLYHFNTSGAGTKTNYWKEQMNQGIKNTQVSLLRFQNYGITEKAQLSLLEGATGPLYLSLTQACGTKHYLESITYLI